MDKEAKSLPTELQKETDVPWAPPSNTDSAGIKPLLFALASFENKSKTNYTCKGFIKSDIYKLPVVADWLGQFDTFS